MAKPIAGRDQFPYGITGITVDAAVLRDGTELTNICVSKQRSTTVFDLESKHGDELYEFMHITSLDKNKKPLLLSDTNEELAAKLEPGKFCITVYDPDKGELVGFAEKLFLNKIILADGSSFYLKSYSSQIDQKVYVTGLALNKVTSAIRTGETDQLTPIFTPSNATIKSVVWESSEPTIASVSRYGLVTGLANGTAIITATSVDGNFPAQCSYTVTTAVQSVSLNKSSSTGAPGGSETLVATVLPYTASNKNVVWSSTNDTIVTVTQGGVVTFVGEGSASVVATSVDDPTKSAQCTYTISIPIVPVTSVSLNKSAGVGIPGGSETLVATVLPDNASNKNVVWSSTDDTKVSVTQTGLVTLIAVGTASVIATSEADPTKSAQCTYTVNEPVISVTGVTLNKTSATVTNGDSDTLIATISPANATNQGVVWSTNKDTVATVTQSGLVNFVGVGEAIITVTTDDGAKTASCTYTVEKIPVHVESITLNSNSETIYQNGTFQLQATVLPADADNKSVTWSTDDDTVCTVSSTGLVTAVGLGAATITATTVDGAKTAQCSFNSVTYVKVTGIQLDKTSPIAMKVGDTITVTATVQPTNATNKNVVWSNPYQEWASSTVSGNTITITAVKVKTTAGAILITASAGSTSTADNIAVAVMITITE